MGKHERLLGSGWVYWVVRPEG